MAKRAKREKDQERFNESDAFSYEEVQGILKYFDIPVRVFSDWWDGQTGVLLPNGKLGFFPWDVDKFVKMHLEQRLKGLR